MEEKNEILFNLEGKICNVMILNKSGNTVLYGKQKIKIRSNILSLIDLDIRIDTQQLEITSHNDKKGIFIGLRLLNHEDIEALTILGM